MMSHMAREISLKYFSNFRCVLLVTEKSHNTEDYIAASIDGYRLDIEDEQLVDNIILKALDEKCHGLIFQVSDPVAMVQAVTRLSRRSLARANRRFFFIPVDVPTTEVKKDRHAKYSRAVDQVLAMREMNFFPDLVMARFEAQNASSPARIELVTHRFVGETSYKDQVVLDIWTERFVFHGLAQFFLFRYLTTL
ncbi:hypothetical protein ANN_26095 [Periplaneta americana]|uniref:Uncharacterized protein n=1 Tax=Periplaneta americana TaxID=6978 RepID=A0ABQ8S5E2_PERAM|nr:hypothetical protein ANN_26095 [Periplaneta americana]